MLYIALLAIVAVAAFFAGAHNAKRAAALKAAALDAAKAVKK
ncbi:MAG TPA: hypothetical protein VLA31_06550 [Burkholderiaceae bacterium]|nr:hypothetical protein [Burkholderiaceae bacterium]